MPQTAATLRASPITSQEDETPQARSLFGEILDWMLAPLLLLWPMSIAVTYLVAQSIANAPFDRALNDNINILARQLRVEGSQVQLRLDPQSQDILRANDTDELFYQVLGKNNEWIAGDRELSSRSLESRVSRQVQYRNELIHGEPIRVAYRLVQLKHQGNIEVLIQVAETLGKREQLANEIIKGVILPQFIILPLAVILVWFALSQGIAPLNKLQHRISARRPDDLSPIAVQEAPEEVAPLVLAFNELLERQTRVIEQQKRFVADAAHQMRTPLAGLRTQAELALRLKDPQDTEASLRQLITSTKQATRLINQLLAMARAENQPPGPEASPKISLQKVVQEVVHEWVPQALQKPVDLGLELDGEDFSIRGQETLLREMLNNLIDNALRYTPVDGHVTVRLHRKDPGIVTLEVEDTGPGIPSHERQLVFDRFYRVLGTGVDGSGLGLAIVREIVQRHQAEISLHENGSSADPRYPGTLFRIAFPCADAADELDEA